MDTNTDRTSSDREEQDDVRGHFIPVVFGGTLAAIAVGFVSTGFEDTRMRLLPVVKRMYGL